MEKVQIPSYTQQVIPTTRNLFKLITLISLLVSSFFLGQLVLEGIDHHLSEYFSLLGKFLLKVLVTFVFMTINSILIMGLCMLGHEASHQVFARNKWLNDLCGEIAWSFFLTPAYGFKEFHINHHRHTHYLEGDPETLMNNRVAWMSLTIGPIYGLYLTGKVMFMNLFSKSKKRIAQGVIDIFFLTLGVLFYFYLLPKLGISLGYLIVPTVVFMPYIFAVRNLTEHHGIPLQDEGNCSLPKEKILDSWILLTHPFLAWLWSDINYHQVHHRYPHLSHRYLRKIFEATREEYPYFIYKGYIPFLLQSFQWRYYGDLENINPFLNQNEETLHKVVH